MAFDPVPFFVGGGALHSAEAARQLAYAVTGGAAGVAAAGDLEITQLPVAGTSVRAASGGAVIPNLYPGGSQQSYTVRAASTTDVSVTATGSGAGRVDLVIARIDDPHYGGTIPADVTVGPYDRLDIIQNVAAGSTDIPAGLAYPAIALARLDIPASTATITTSMITDLRKVAGQGGAWTAWTPTITGFTVGNGTVAGRYRKVGHDLELNLFITFGTTSAVTGTLSMSLPLGLTAASEFTLPLRFFAATGNIGLVGLCRVGNSSGTGTDLLPYQQTSTTNGLLVRIGSIGFTFGLNSTISFSGTVETTT